MASFGDAFGGDDGTTINPGETMTSQLAGAGAPMPPDYQAGMTVNPADVMTRMLRKGLSDQQARDTLRQKQPKEPADAAELGTPVTSIAPLPPEAPAAEPEKPVTYGDELKPGGVIDKAFAAPIVHGAGAALKTAGLFGAERDAYLADLASGRQKSHVGAPYGTMDTDPNVPAAQVDATGNTLYRAGQAVQDYGDRVHHLTPAEQDTWAAHLSGAAGAVAPALAASAINPLLGMAVGGAQMGTQSAADTFDAAIRRGVDPNTAAEAANLSAVVNTAAGMAPLGVVLRPLEKVGKAYAPAIMGYAATKLAGRAAEGAAAFATIGEAQEWIAGQIEKDFYPADPKNPESGYVWDGKRFTTNAIVGAITGLIGHGGRGKETPPPTPAPNDPNQRLPGPDNRPGPDTGATPGGGPGPGPGPGPQADTPDQTRRRGAMEEAVRGYGLDPADMSFGEMKDALHNRDILAMYGLSKEEIQGLGLDHTPAFQAALKEAMETGSQHPTTGEGAPGTASNPVDASGIDAVKNRIDADPSAGQAQAENYPHIHAEVPELGLTGKNGISVETVKGGTRKGPVDEATGQPAWTSTMGAHYGRIKGTIGADGQPLDISTGNVKDAPYVFVLDQKDPKTGSFDEHKIFARMKDQHEAYKAYLDSHDAAGRSRIGGMRALNANEFKAWIKSGQTTEPLSDSMKASEKGLRNGQDARDESHSRVQRLEGNEEKVQQSEQHVLSRLRGAGDQGLPRVGGKFPDIHQGHGGQANAGSLHRQEGQQQGIQQGQLPLGNASAASAKYAPSDNGAVPGAGSPAHSGLSDAGVKWNGGATSVERGLGNRESTETGSEGPSRQEHLSDISGGNANSSGVGGKTGVQLGGDKESAGRRVGHGGGDNEASDKVSQGNPLALTKEAGKGETDHRAIKLGPRNVEEPAAPLPQQAAGPAEGATMGAGGPAPSAAPQPTTNETVPPSGPRLNEEKIPPVAPPTQAQIQEVRKTLAEAGVPPYPHDHVDIARAIQIRDRELRDMVDAFQIAVLRNRLDEGFLTPEQVRAEQPAATAEAVLAQDEGSSLLVAERPSEHGLQSETPSPGSRGPDTASQSENGTTRGGEVGGEQEGADRTEVAEGGTEPDTASLEPDAGHAEPDTGVTAADTEDGGRTEPVAAGGEPTAESHDEATEHAGAAGEHATEHAGEREATGAAEDAGTVTQPPVPKELYHVAPKNFDPSDGLKSLRERYEESEAQEIFDQRWPGAEELRDYHINYVFFYDNMEDAKRHSQSPFGQPGGTILRVNPKKVKDLWFHEFEDPGTGKQIGFWVSEAGYVAPEAITKISEPHAVETSTEPEPEKNKIEDAGEKIGGARKDAWGNRGLDISDLDNMTPVERIQYTTKENVWPRPDYVKMVERGVEPKAAFLIKRIYDRLAAQPSRREVTNGTSAEEMQAKYIKAMRVVREEAEKAATVAQVEVIHVAFHKAHTRFDESGKQTGSDYEGRESIRIPLKQSWRTRSDPLHITRDDLRQADRAVADGFPKTEPWQRFISIHKWSEDSFKLYRKGKKDTLLDGTYKTREEAQAAARALHESWKEGGDNEQPKAPERPHLDSLERTGPDYRGGRNVTGEDFIKDFGFRGVEFGNWVADDERQKMVNQAYDGLHDLARILGLPPKAMSLDGTLAMGFGSRGKGGRAAAHYEPGLKVFNFTKLSGAGSVAHEWAHALDHYLGTFGGQNQPDTMATGGRKTVPSYLPHLPPRLANALIDLTQALFARKESEALRKERIANEMRLTEAGKKSWEGALENYKNPAQFRSWGTRKRANEIATARQQIDMRARNLEKLQKQLDNPSAYRNTVPTDYHTQATRVSGSDYYGRPDEMFARAFESWVFDRIIKEGNRSDYLVHGVEPSRFEQGYKGNPYPAGEEREAFGKGFERVFRAITTGEGKHGEGTKLEGVRGEDPERNSTISVPVEPAEPTPLDNTKFTEDLDKTGDESATNEAEVKQPKPLAEHFLSHFRTGEGFMGILQARKFAKEAGFSHDAKAVEEALELAVVKRAREVVAEHETPAATFEALRYLYGQQPNLGTRTSTSVRDQAYSTPVPLAYVASRLADINKKTTVYEPTAGNGALLIEANPDKSYPNEINPDRAANLKGQGFAPSKNDASDRAAVTGLEKSVDRVIANPPFGTVVEDGASKIYDLSDIQKGYRTTQVDHAIALEALKAMKDDGKAVLILGGINKQITDPKDRADAYNGKAKREFFLTLYGKYNVVDHVTVDGDLYAKQGAAWPVDLIVIDGRGKSARSLPAIEAPRVLHTWDEVGGLLNGQGTGRSTVDRPDDTPATAGAERPAAGGNGGGGVPDEPGRAPAGPAEPGRRGGIQPGTIPDGEPADAVDQHAPLDQARGEPAGHDRPADTERPPLGLSDLSDFLNDTIEEMYGPDTPPEEQAQEKPKESTAKPRAKPSGAKREPDPLGELSESARKAFEALGTMFGGKAKLSMGITVDPEKYEQAKPLFKEAAKHFRNFIDDLREFGRRILAKLREIFEFSKEALKELVPYINKFIGEVHLGEIKLDDDEDVKQEETPKTKVAEKALDKETTLQVRYTPKSDGPGMGTLVPINMRENITASLNALESRVGNIDDFVTKELGYGSKEDLWKAVGAEQVDALALAVDNMKAGKGFIIGDQTGIGKGRVNAGIIRWALKNDKIPVFFTKGPDLYADIYRDLIATGIKDLLGAEPRMLMTNGGQRVPLDEEGKTVLTSGPTAQHNQILNALNADNFRDNHDIVFTTYNQINTIKGEDTARRRFLNAISPNAVLVFDESHNAGGQGTKAPAAAGAVNRAVFARNLIDASARNGTFYSSATYAKRPDVMDLYRATDMRLAANTPDEMEELFKRGGIPLQQVVASMLAEGGQYIRRERSFDGIAYNTPVVPVDKDQYNGFSRALSLIQDFSEARKAAVAAINEAIKVEGQAVSSDGSTGTGGASSINFTSVMHNIINQMLLAAKAKPAADAAIAAIERGEKPVLTVANTMGSFLADYADNLGISHGEEMTADFRDVLMKYLDRTRTVTIRKPFMEKGEKAETHYLTDEELGPAGREAYRQAQEHIKTLDLSNLSVSPIDDIKSRIEAAGYKVGEITGRNDYVDFSGDTPTFQARSGVEKSITGRRKTISGFNSLPPGIGHNGGPPVAGANGIHAVIINQAGSTGISMHASETFQDQRPRRMIIVQPEANIDTHMQMLGRVHRTGQVVVPTYDQMVADIPAEKRPAAVLAKKMASLNANTTASRGSALTAEDVPDFMNEVGDQIAAEWILENPEMNRRLGYPLHIKETGEVEKEGAMRSVTGRIPLLPYEQQVDAYKSLEGEYSDRIAEMDAAGENTLEAKTLDVKAKTLETTEVQGKKSGSNSPFAAPVNIEKVRVNRLGKPMSPDELMQRVADEIGVGIEGGTPSEFLQRLEDPTWNHLVGMQSVPGHKAYLDREGAEGRAILAEFESYKRGIVDEIKDPKKAEEERVKLDAIKTRWMGLRQMLLPGKRITLKTADGNITAVALKVERKGQAKNPLALGTWKAIFATADANRQVAFSFSRLFEQGSDPDNDTHIDVEPLRYESYADTLGRFERQQSQLTEERYIATGNILASYGWLNAKGKIINFTDDKGGVRQGIMTPGKFNLNTHFREKGRVLASPKEVMDQLTKFPRTPVFAKSGFVSVRNGPYGVLEVITNKVKRAGGIYYLDKPLAGMTDTGNFVSSGGNMKGNIEARNATSAIARMQELGAVFSAPMAEGPKTQKVEDEPPQATVRQSRGLTGPAEARRLLQTPAALKARNEVETGLQRLLERLLGNKYVDFKFPDVIPMDQRALAAWGMAGQDAATGGQYSPPAAGFGKALIQIAMEQPVSTFKGQDWRTHYALHEAVHALQNIFATDQERALMARETPRLRKIVEAEYRDMGKDQPEKMAAGMSDAEIQAEAGRIYMGARARGETPGVHIGLRGLWERIMAIARKVRDFFMGHGVKTFENLMDAFYEGKIADREGRGMPEPPKAGRPEAPMASIVHDVSDRVRNRISDALGSDTATNLREGLHDQSERVRLMKNDVEAMYRNWRNADGELPDEKDFYELKRLFPNKKAARIDVFDKEHFDPLEKWMRANKFDIDAAGRYLTSLHVPERNAEIGKLYPAGHDFNRAINDHDVAGGSGFSWNEAKKMNAEAKNGQYAHLLPELRRRMTAIRDWTQQEMRRGRLESQSTIDKWNSTYKNYINMSGWEDPLEEPEEVKLREMGRKKNAAGVIAGPEVKTAFGRKTLADNPITNAIKSAYRTIERAEKNLVQLSLARAVIGLPKEARREIGVRYDKGAPMKIVDPHTGLAREINNPADRFSNRAVPYKIDGETHFLLFDDPRIAEAMNRWSPTQLGGVLRLIQTIQQKWKSLITIYSPSFEARHQTRYYIENMLNAMQLKETGKYSPGQLAKDSFPLVGAATRAIFAHEMGNGGGGKLGRYWAEMKAGGGATAMKAMRDMDNFKDEMRTKLANFGSGNMNPIRWLRESAKVVHLVTSIMDNAQRLGQYAAARDQGQSPQKAAIVAAEATVDYNMRGLWSNYISLAQPFFNVAEKTGARMWGRQGRSAIMRKVMLATFGLGLAMSAWNYAAGGTDTDGIPFVDKVAPWEANKALVIMMPWDRDEKGRPGVFKLPFPFNWAFPLSSGSAIGNFIWGSGTAPQILMQRVVGPFLSTFSQVGEEGLGLNTIIPEIMKAPYEVATNKDWKGSPIHNDLGQKGPNSESGKKDIGDYERTGEGWKDIAKTLNYLSGGTQQRSGVLDFYPEDIKTIFEPYIGTMLTLMENVGATAGSIMKGEAPKATTVPVSKIFYGTDYDAADSAHRAKQAYERSHPWNKSIFGQ